MNLGLILLTAVLGTATVSVDDPQPRLAEEAFDELARLWQEGRYSGACLSGEIRADTERGSVLYITHAFSAAYVERCHGRKNVGAVSFHRDEVLDSEIAQQAARLLAERADWLVVGAVTGMEYVTTRNSRGAIEDAMALSAQFSVRTNTIR